MDCDEAAVGQDLVRGLVGAGIGGSSNSAFVVVAVLRDDRGEAAQIVPEQYPAWPCLPFRKRGEQASESVAASRF